MILADEGNGVRGRCLAVGEVIRQMLFATGAISDLAGTGRRISC